MNGAPNEETRPQARDDGAGEPKLSPNLLMCLIGLVVVLPTAVVVYDIVRDRTTIEFYDFRPDGMDGLWRVRCGPIKGMVIEFRSVHALGAVGHVRIAGRGDKFGYRAGDEVFRVSVGSDGAWRGKILWRRLKSPPHWLDLKFLKRGRHIIGESPGLRCFEHMKRRG